jgi:putative hydrolases of HD superfamily
VTGLPPLDDTTTSTMSHNQLEATTRFLYEVGHLKHSKRTGWWFAGIKDPETVAEHSFRVAVIGYVLALMEGADPALTTTLCLFHDLPETRVGDIPHTGKRYLSHPSPAAMAADQVEGMPASIAETIIGLVDEYASKHSKEAQLAGDADKLECLLQAREYQAQSSFNVQAWIISNRAKLRSTSARKLATVAIDLPPDQWWSLVSESIGPPTNPPVPDSGPA